MSDRDIYERLGDLERLIKHLYKQTGIPLPDPQAIISADVSDHVRQLAASGDKMGAIKAYRIEANADLATAHKVIDSLYS